MTVPHLATVRQRLMARRERTARAWQRALARSGFVALAASEVYRHLDELTGRIIELLLTDVPTVADGQSIGASLVRVHFVQPGDLGETLRLLAQELIADLPPDAMTPIAQRFSFLMGGVAIGFTQEARNLLLDEQDAIRGALLRQRQQAQAALALEYAATERARGELRAVLDAASDGMLLLSPERKALMVNRRFEALFDMPGPLVIGHTFAELAQTLAQRLVDPPALKAFLDSLAITDAPRSFDLSVRYPEARELALYTTAVRTPDGDLLGRLHAFRDVTREREVDRMKSEFVSLVSHELRTPLTSIKGYVDLLVAGDVGPLAPEQAEFLHIVQQNADREVALITDLLDLSRMESGKLTLERRALPLGPLMEQIGSVFRLQLAAKQQRLILELPEELPAVWGDEQRLLQIFTNLVSNAHKYTPPGGTITIRASPGAEQVVIAVQDDGIGLPPEEQAQLFTRFYRARNDASADVGGTGLGLAITRELVVLHGGTIEVESAPGEGSSFRVALPVAPAARALPTGAGAPNHRTILVVEDEPAIAELLRGYLERGGYHVLTAAGGAEALHLAEQAQPALITLDLGLPDVDGFTLLEWLKQQPSTTAIPVLILSASEDQQRGTLLGCVDYLVKPFSQETLLRHVQAQLPVASGPLVLVVDDDADIRTLLDTILQRAGYRVILAADAEAGTQLAHQQHPALLVLDVRLPGMDGLTALRALRGSPDTATLPVILLTASPGAREESASVQAEMAISGILTKPCPAETLVTCIAGILGGQEPSAELPVNQVEPVTPGPSGPTSPPAPG